MCSREKKRNPGEIGDYEEKATSKVYYLEISNTKREKNISQTVDTKVLEDKNVESLNGMGRGKEGLDQWSPQGSENVLGYLF